MKFAKYVELREDVGNVIPQNVKNHVNHRLQVLLRGKEGQLPIEDIRKVLFASGIEIDEDQSKYSGSNPEQRVMGIKYDGMPTKSALIVSMPITQDSVRIN